MLRRLVSFVKTGYRRRPSRPRQPLRARPRVERLEAREVPTVFNVTTQADLASAIVQANADISGDVINIVVSNITLTSPLPVVTNTMTIQGGLGSTQVGLGPLSQSGFPVLDLELNGNAMTLANLDIKNGQAVTNATPGDGGGVHAFAQLTMTNCTVEKCSADHNGGGVAVILANATFTGCSFLHNTAGNDGGGLSFNSSGVQNLTLQSNSTFTQNFFNEDFATNGGGLFYWANGNLSITDTTFGSGGGNTATFCGGAICADCNNFTLTITHSGGAVVGNSALTGAGGGLYLVVQSNAFINVMFMGNSAPHFQTTADGLVLYSPNAVVTYGPNFSHFDPWSQLPVTGYTGPNPFA